MGPSVKQSSLDLLTFLRLEYLEILYNSKMFTNILTADSKSSI